MIMVVGGIINEFVFLMNGIFFALGDLNHLACRSKGTISDVSGAHFLPFCFDGIESQ